MPWATIITVIMKLIDLLLVSKARKDKMRREMFDFVAKWDASLLESLDLRAEYKDLLKRAMEARKKKEEKQS